MRQLLMLLAISLAAPAAFGQSLMECRIAAARNLPAVKRHGLIARDSVLTVERLSTAWLPQGSASAQATLQNAVVTLPPALRQMMEQSGYSESSLSKGQYRVGVDVSQLLYDGGAVRARRDVAARQADVDHAQANVDIYTVYARVDELYFCLLLFDNQIALADELQVVLRTNEDILSSMARHGTAADCDHLVVRAERLSAEQQTADLRAQREVARQLLSLLCGMEVTSVEEPPFPMEAVGGVNRRPELTLADTRLRLADAQQAEIDSRLRPTVSLFGQAFFGYPGYDMFHDLGNHNPTVNALIGAKVTWNLGALYTRKADLGKVGLLREQAELGRESFLYDNALEQSRHRGEVARYRQQAAADAEIIALREQVRRASESKLAHGIIAVNDLVRDIYQENVAKAQQAIHHIKALQSMYNLLLSSNQQL